MSILFYTFKRCILPRVLHVDSKRSSQIFGSKYLRTDDSGLSVGDPIDVDGTVYDYRNSVMMGYRLEHMINDKNPHGGLDNR